MKIRCLLLCGVFVSLLLANGSAITKPLAPKAMNPMSLPTGIVPILDCVTFDQSTNTVTAFFGYVSVNAQTESVPYGPANFFSPSPAIRPGQPTSFLPGVHHNAFSVSFSLNVTTLLLRSRGLCLAGVSLR